MRRYLFFLFVFFFCSVQVQAQKASIPRFASLRKNLVYMRAGPGKRFPIEWVYQKKGLPVEIIDKFEHWYKVRDNVDSQAWIHKSMLSKKRTALTAKNQKTILYEKPSISSPQLFILNGQHIISLIECHPVQLFCKVKFQEKKAFVIKNNLYGLYQDEEIDL